MIQLQVRYILMDIEGTVSDINFVKRVLFPYSREHLPSFIEQNWSDPTVNEKLSLLLEKPVKTSAQIQHCINQLLDYIDCDIKNESLKFVQGLIWQKGFESKRFTAPLYPDVLPNWKRWSSMGLPMGIYSSGSVQAQKLFFQHTEQGNILPFLDQHFDLSIGSKKASTSYLNIAETLKVPATSIVFLSDITQELASAAEAELQVVHVVRPGTQSSDSFPVIESFNELKLQ